MKAKIKRMPKPKILQIDVCDSCAKDKEIVFISKVKQNDRPERITSLCADCFRRRCLCSICSKRMSYSSYERHLLKSHSNNQLALQLVNDEVFSDFRIFNIVANNGREQNIKIK